MDSITIIPNRSITLAELTLRVSQQWPVEQTPLNDLVIHGPSSRVYIRQGADVERPGIQCLFLDYSRGLQLVKQVLEIIGDDPKLTIDNDFGTVLPGNEFVARLRADPDWDWRVAR